MAAGSVILRHASVINGVKDWCMSLRRSFHQAGCRTVISSLWGVGWAIVRYRKNGVLRRLQATPLSPLEFLAVCPARR